MAEDLAAEASAYAYGFRLAWEVGEVLVRQLDDLGVALANLGFSVAGQADVWDVVVNGLELTARDAAERSRALREG